MAFLQSALVNAYTHYYQAQKNGTNVKSLNQFGGGLGGAVRGQSRPVTPIAIGSPMDVDRTLRSIPPPIATPKRPRRQVKKPKRQVNKTAPKRRRVYKGRKPRRKIQSKKPKKVVKAKKKKTTKRSKSAKKDNF